VRLDLDEPVDAVAPGQAGVLYDGDLVIGGGTVASTEAVGSRPGTTSTSAEATTGTP
jgi:hypothetical protein